MKYFFFCNFYCKWCQYVILSGVCDVIRLVTWKALYQFFSVAPDSTKQLCARQFNVVCTLHHISVYTVRRQRNVYTL
jgi:hypothetical protein